MKPPAFQFYPQDWLSSIDISLMTLAEEGAYHRLLCWAWTQHDCGLPADHVSLAQLSRMGEDWELSKDRILNKFRLENGRLYNDRLLVERRRQEEWRKKSAAGGRASAIKRLAKGGSRVVQPPYNQTGKGGASLLSSSSSSSPRTVVQLTNQTHREQKSATNPVVEFLKANKYPEIVDGTFEAALSTVNTPELFETFRVNTMLWMNTEKYQKGRCKDSKQFLLSGVWKHPPPDHLLQPNGQKPQKPIRWYVDIAEEGKSNEA